jgi:hypothetical protein
MYGPDLGNTRSVKDAYVETWKCEQLSYIPTCIVFGFFH